MVEPIEYPPLEMPDNVTREKITIWSNGIPLDGDIYRPDGLTGDTEVPGIVLSHGWGGDKYTPERYAAKFASAGMITLCFTYSTWGESAGPLVPVDPQPSLDPNGQTTVAVRTPRDVMDPIAWVDDYRAALAYLIGEPHVDVDRIGAWGTSFGGGTAITVAATDPRVKALAVQVAMVIDIPEPFLELGVERATQIARGEIDPVPQGTDSFPGMRGTPHLAKLLHYDVPGHAARLKIPTLFVDAANEEFFVPAQSSGAAHAVLDAGGEVPTYYEVIDGIDHYGIYFDGYERSSQLAYDWFCQQLNVA